MSDFDDGRIPTNEQETQYADAPQNMNVNEGVAEDISQESNQTNKADKIIIILLSACLILSVISLYISCTYIGKVDTLKKENEKLLTECSNAIDSMERKVSKLKDDNQALDYRISAQQYDIDELFNSVDLMDLGILVSDAGIVTEKIYSDKMVIRVYDENEGYAILDIEPQPAYNQYFMGQGSINLSDREIRAMLDELIVQLKNFVKDSPRYADLINFDTLQIDITHNNYNIAKYQNGVIKLSGE